MTTPATCYISYACAILSYDSLCNTIFTFNKESVCTDLNISHLTYTSMSMLYMEINYLLDHQEVTF